jgi:dihydroflavonol-4-reductase
MGKELYLLTGAAGNLGSSIARQLVAEGKVVRALVLKGDPAAERVPRQVDVMIGDVTDAATLEPFFSTGGGTDVIVIHCASIVTVSPDYSRKVHDVNVTGTRNIVDMCIEHGVRKLVYISSTGAIPELPHGQEIMEIADFTPDAVIGFYGQTKAEATRIVMDAVRQRSLDASIVFPSGIGGPGDFAYGPAASFIIDYVQGKMSAGVEGSFNAVDVRDLADGVIACCAKGRKGEGYIMANACISMKEMFRLISSLGGAREIRMILPVPIAMGIARLSGIISRLTRKPARMTTFAIHNLSRDNTFCSEKAERELGYHVRPFEETIMDTIEWLREEHRIGGSGDEQDGMPFGERVPAGGRT